MKGLMKKVRENKKGFTLAELLVVVAIVGILVAISIPVFTAQLSKARKATNQANLRAAKAAAVAQFLTDADDASETTYYYDIQTGAVETVTTGDTNYIVSDANKVATIDAAASDKKYDKIDVNIKPNTVTNATDTTLNGAEITLYATKEN